MDTQDYSKWTHEDLLLEEKKIKKQEIFSAFGIGLLVGVMVFGVVKNGFGFIYIAIPLLLISGLYKNSQKNKNHLKQIQAAMSTQNTKSS